MKICHERADSWSDTVKACIFHVHDLHATDAVFNFVTKNGSVDYRRLQEAKAWTS